MQACDLVLVEGFKQEAFPKIEVFRNVNGKSPLWLQKKDILALATDAPAAATHGDQTRTWFDLTDIRAIADFVETHACPLPLGR
jgi:molybdopterin-guanine dinucleotide biosynthesis protein B